MNHKQCNENIDKGINYLNEFYNSIIIVKTNYKKKLLFYQH